MPSTYARQSLGTQSQGRSRRREADSEEEDDDVEEQGGGTQLTGGLNEVELKKGAAKLVRMALASEYMKRPLRRADASKFITRGSWAAIYNQAQKTLKETYGMELVEVRAKWKAGEDETQAQTQATQAARKKGKGIQRLNDIQEEDEEDEEDEDEESARAKKKKALTTNMYMLRSIIPVDILSQMADPVPFDRQYPPEDEQEQDSGALLNWEKADATSSGHIALLGIRSIILSLIMSHGRIISDDHLHALLRRLDLERDTVLHYTSTSAKAPEPITLDKYLDILDKQLYLQKIKTGTIDAPSIEWKFGQREIEFNEMSAAQFIEDVMFDGEEEALEEEERLREERRRTGNGEGNGTGTGRRRGRGRNEEEDDERRGLRKEKKRLRENLSKAAGGPLIGDL